MTKAVIDIGTNSIKLLAGDNKDGSLIIAADDVIITKLGDELETSGAIGNAAYKRTLDGIAELVSRAAGLGAGDLRIIGTAGLRRASNAADFCASVKERTGRAVDIISGEEEARLGTAAGLELAEGHPRAVLFDIGGGSCEAADVTRGKITASASLPFGALTLLRYLDDPAIDTQKGIYIIEENIKNAVNAEFPHIETEHGCFAAVSGGSIATAASVVLGRIGGREELHGYVLTMSEIKRQIERYASLDEESLSKIPGMTHGRERTVLTGVIILKVLLECWSCESAVLSTMGLRYGALCEMLCSDGRFKTDR